MRRPKDIQNDLIKPAVDGTLSVMRAAAANNVERVVITSSVAAMMMTNDAKKTHFTEDDWSD